MQEEGFPGLIFIIQKLSVSAPHLILTTAPDLPSPLLVIESLTSRMSWSAVLAMQLMKADFNQVNLGLEGLKNKASIYFASSVEFGF